MKIKADTKIVKTVLLELSEEEAGRLLHTLQRLEEGTANNYRYCQNTLNELKAVLK